MCQSFNVDKLLACKYYTLKGGFEPVSMHPALLMLRFKKSTSLGNIQSKVGNKLIIKQASFNFPFTSSNALKQRGSCKCSYLGEVLG